MRCTLITISLIFVLGCGSSATPISNSPAQIPKSPPDPVFVLVDTLPREVVGVYHSDEWSELSLKWQREKARQFLVLHEAVHEMRVNGNLRQVLVSHRIPLYDATSAGWKQHMRWTRIELVKPGVVMVYSKFSEDRLATPLDAPSLTPESTPGMEHPLQLR